MTDREYLAKCEVEYEKILDEIADKVGNDRKIKLVLIAGPSCAGKTTTTKKLKSRLCDIKGVKAYMLSLDDFYKSPENAPLDENGKPDLESVNSLDLDYLRECLHNISVGKTTYVPHFDFNKRKRSDTFRKIKLEENEVCFIEGLHAHNPELYMDCVADEAIYRVFLDPKPYDCYPFSPSGLRRIRRLVRDYHYRSANAESTFSMWASVRNGEKKYIYPYLELADVIVNTFFEYEASVLKDEAIKIVSEVERDSEYFDDATEIVEKLSRYRSIDPSNLPEGSLMREFILRI